MNIFYGTIKFYSLDKGFGFIEPKADTGVQSGQDGRGKDVFFHRTALERAAINPEEIMTGDEVSFELSEFKGKKTAANITILQRAKKKR